MSIIYNNIIKSIEYLIKFLKNIILNEIKFKI